MRKGGRKRRIVFWSLVTVGVVVVLLGVSTLACNLVVTRSAAAYIRKTPDQAPQAQTGVVLGAGVQPGGAPSPMLQDRLDTGIKLYKASKVTKLLLSGSPVQVRVMLKYCQDRSVPDQDIFTDYAGLNTYDTMYRAAHVYEVKDALVVTQKFHVARAVYTARSLGLRAVGVVADIQPYFTLDDRLREVAARVKAVLQLDVTRPKAPELGPSVPISGDGRASRAE